MLEQDTVGRVTTSATIENLEDHWEVGRGLRAPGRIRRLELDDLAISSKVFGLSLPTRLIRQLGLRPFRMCKTIHAGVIGEAMRYHPVRLTIMNEPCTVEVLEVPDEMPATFGEVYLDFLNLMIDPQGRRPIANPALVGEQLVEMY